VAAWGQAEGDLSGVVDQPGRYALAEKRKKISEYHSIYDLRVRSLDRNPAGQLDETGTDSISRRSPVRRRQGCRSGEPTAEAASQGARVLHASADELADAERHQIDRPCPH
jgi:hypothetical protein